MRVRVGIVSYQTAALLDRCLAALPAALGDLDAEVVVWDNASADGSADVAEAHPGVRVLRSEHNVGYGRGMNAALAGAGADVLVALNPDTEPPPGSLAALVAVLAGRPEAGVVVPRLVHPDGGTQHSVYRFPSLRLAAVANLVPVRLHRGRLARRFWLEGRAPHDVEADVDWAIGAVHCIRASALDGPPYSEDAFMYVEDLDLCWRLRQRGWRVRLAGAVAIPHVGGASAAPAFGAQRRTRWWRETYRWYARVHGVRRARLYALLNLVGSAARSTMARLLLPLPGGRDRRRWLATELRADVPVHLAAAQDPRS